MEQTLRLYKNLDKLLILTFWEIIKSNNILLLDIEFNEEKVYTENQKSELTLLWSKLYDDYYDLKKDSKAIIAIEQSNEALLLLSKIELLQNNYNSLISLYENIDILPSEDFYKIEQGIYNNFQLIDNRIKCDIFKGLEGNYKKIIRFISSFKTQYDINHKRVNQNIEKEVENIYKIIVSVSNILTMQLNVKEMSVSEWIAYEQMAKEKVESQKKLNNGK